MDPLLASSLQTILINRENDISFITYYPTLNNNTDIILSKGLRTSVTNNEVVFHKQGDTITDNSSPNQLIIPYGRDFRTLPYLESRVVRLELITFRQSIIDHTIIITPYCDLQDKITNNQTFPTTIKTSVGEDIYPKTFDTFLTAFYTSYIKTSIPQTTNTTKKPLLYYYCTNQSHPAIIFSVVNSTYYTSPQLYI
jgi:hypothetical protein